MRPGTAAVSNFGNSDAPTTAETNNGMQSATNLAM